MLFRKRKKKKLWGVYAVRNLLRFFQQLKKSTNHLKIKMMKKTEMTKIGFTENQAEIIETVSLKCELSLKAAINDNGFPCIISTTSNDYVYINSQTSKLLENVGLDIAVHINYHSYDLNVLFYIN